MNKYTTAAAALLFAVVPNLQAGGLLAEPVPVAYINMPFGGDAKTATSYGLRLARLEHEAQPSAILSAQERSSYLDVKFSEGDLSGLSLNGTDFVALAKLHGYNANEDNSVQQWWSGLSDNQKAFFALAGIVAVGCLTEWCQQEEDECTEEPRLDISVRSKPKLCFSPQSN